MGVDDVWLDPVNERAELSRTAEVRDGLDLAEHRRDLVAGDLPPVVGPECPGPIQQRALWPKDGTVRQVHVMAEPGLALAREYGVLL